MKLETELAHYRKLQVEELANLKVSQTDELKKFKTVHDEKIIKLITNIESDKSVSTSEMWSTVISKKSKERISLVNVVNAELELKKKKAKNVVLVGVKESISETDKKQHDFNQVNAILEAIGMEKTKPIEIQSSLQQESLPACSNSRVFT